MGTGNFNCIARPYRWLEYASFGPFLLRCRLAQLPAMRSARRALILGDGDGRFLAHLLQTNPELSADAVDSSRSMLETLDQRISNIGDSARRRVELHHADVLTWTAKGKYDLVVSHFFLDCFFEHQLDDLLVRIAPHLEKGARWVVSEFSIPAGGPAAHLSAVVVRLLYEFFGLITGLAVRDLPDYGRVMRDWGFYLGSEQDFLGGLLESQLWFLAG
ncbi:MAG TPA: class I SAM-dependent methyltransferase [Acidobacteriaceae bacterium]